MSQFQVVSYYPSSNIVNLCDNIKLKVDLSRFTHVDFDKRGKIDQDKVEEVIYEIITTFKNTPIEIANSLPKSLYDRVE